MRCAGTLVTFYGCWNNLGPLPLTSYAIDIYDHSGGTLLQSVTTNAAGEATVTATGSVWYLSADGCFSGQTVTVASGIALTVVASGYTCSPGFAIPLKNTLKYTDVNVTAQSMPVGSGTWGVCCTASLATTITAVNNVTCLPTVVAGTIPYGVVLQNPGTYPGLYLSAYTYPSGGYSLGIPSGTFYPMVAITGYGIVCSHGGMTYGVAYCPMNNIGTYLPVTASCTPPIIFSGTWSGTGICDGPWLISE